jgi:hypothetical protein
MMNRLAASVALLLCMAAALPASAQTTTPPERAVRRDIPLFNTIQRAHAAGTRDSTGRPGRNYWANRTDYVLEARLDPASARIHGAGRITLHNASPDSLPFIVLRLNPNIFRGLSPRGFSVPAENTDGILITRLAVNGHAVDLTAPPAAGSQRPPQPVAAGLTSTVARILLPSAIPAGSTATLDVEWNMKLPGGAGGQGHRMTMRWADTLFQPTQWFPRVAMYDDLRGWDTEPYLGPAEFYNPFGRYDIRIDVPAGWLVSGTGVLQNPEQVLTARARERLALVTGSDSVTTIVGADETGPGRATQHGRDGRLVWHFVADSVNDFAWATASSYVWRATRANVPGRGPVPIHMLHLPGRANLFANAGALTRHALEFYSGLWFPYPFPQLTLQDGPSAGMEYPMVLNSNQGAADHETAHQWWPMVVGTDETRYGWMDEGLNQYMNILSAAARAGREPNLDRLGQSYGGIAGSEYEPIMMWSANWAGPMYGFQTYQKTPLMLSMLGGIVGDTAVQRAIRGWAGEWRFSHPTPWDFMFYMDRALDQDLGWFWYAWLFSNATVDGSIRSVTSTGNRTDVVVHQAGEMPSPIVLRVELAAAGPPVRAPQNARMLDERTALVTLPVDVWFAGARTHTVTLDFGGRAIERITLDPHARFPDRNPADNVWPRQERGG